MVLLLFAACKKGNSETGDNNRPDTSFVSAVDISSYPEIMKSNPVFYDLVGNRTDFLQLLKAQGVNTIRLRLWVNPTSEHSGFQEVKQFSQMLKNQGFRVWLTLHYSDTWADPGSQITPAAWRGLNFSTLKDTVYAYTARVVTEIKPTYIQIGNEINDGMLHPVGKITTHPSQFIELLKSGSAAVRSHSKDTKIILHFAGIQGANWFYNQLGAVDYDLIGLSYYPIWHGKSLPDLRQTLQALSNAHQKDVLLCETAYPFTLGWNDWTHNVVGLDEHLIMPGYPASAEGQRKFMQDMKSLLKGLPRGAGFCYWGAELIAWKGKQATDASSWENQALFDFNNQALPVWNEFKSP